MLILLRLSSEITIKSDRVRSRFVKSLLFNIKSAFRKYEIPVTYDNQWGRIFLKIEDVNFSKTKEILQRIFGIATFSPISMQAGSDFSEIVRIGTELFQPIINNSESFAVRVRRTGKHPYTSVELERTLGERLNSKLQGKVKLKNPDQTVWVEIRNDVSYFYTEVIKGPHGLPLGTAGKALCLISGGFDSVVCAWLLYKRGVTLDFLLCNMAGAAFENSVIKVALTLWQNWGFGHRPEFYVADFSEMANGIKTHVKSAYSQVVLKRMFLRTADTIAQKNESLALITGECIGQVSSQTLANLHVIDKASSMLVLRPAISYDKEEIIDLARKIGTYEVCAPILEFCQLVQEKPATHCRERQIEEQEAKLPKEIFVHTIESIKKFDLGSSKTENKIQNYLFVDKIREGSKVIDCSTVPFEPKIGDWQDFSDLAANFRCLDKSENYTIVCSHGTQSTLIAELMQNAGYEAYTLRGGLIRTQS